MAFPSINEFKSRLLDGGARPSLFEMELTFPPALGIQGVAATEIMKFHCRISEIPGTQHNPIVFKFAGREIKYAGQRVFNNLTLTIVNDEGFRVRRGLEKWFEAMNGAETNVNLLTSNLEGTAGTYAAQGTVTQYDKQGFSARKYSFRDIFPVTIAPIALDWSNDGAIEDYTCEFAYQYWEVDIKSVAV